MTKSPKIRFSRWFPWCDRDNLPNIDRPGIYIMAHFDEVPSGRASRHNNQIEYIGKTWGEGGLKERLKKFHRVATKGKGNHSGGKTYHKKHHKIKDDLYVAVCPFLGKSHEVDLNTFILYAERKLIWQFSAANGRLPNCNNE